MAGIDDLQYSNFLLLVALASTTLLILLQVIFSNKSSGGARRSRKPLPPSPPALPIIGHLHLIGKYPHRSLSKVSDRYGPIVYLRFGYKPSLLVSSAEVARECLKTHESCFLNRPQRANIEYLSYGNAGFTIAPYGPLWKFLRKLTVSKLLGASMMDAYLPIRTEEVRQLVRSLRDKAEAREEVDVRAQLMKLTNNVVSRMALKQKCARNEDEAYEMRHVIDEMCDLAARWNLQDFFWFCKNLDLQRFGKRLREVRQRYDNLIGRIIEDHEDVKKRRKENMGLSSNGDNNNDNNNNGELKDILDMLLDAYEDENSEVKLTKQNIHAYVMNIFGAGTETQAVTMEWALSELINHPEAMAKARQEISRVVGDQRLVDESDLPNLPYVQAITKETLRLHPGGLFIARESSVDCTVAGYHVSANTRLFINTWAINRDPKHWDDPHVFRPERFLVDDISISSTTGKMIKRDLDVKGHHFQLLPFGSGRRVCPGINLALLMVPTTVAALVQCFDWKVGKDGNGVVDMEEGFGLSLPMAKPLKCFPVVRLNSFPL